MKDLQTVLEKIDNECPFVTGDWGMANEWNKIKDNLLEDIVKISDSIEEKLAPGKLIQIPIGSSWAYYCLIKLNENSGVVKWLPLGAAISSLKIDNPNKVPIEILNKYCR